MVSDIMYDPKYLGLLLLYAFAIFYIAECIVDFSSKFRYVKKVKGLFDDSYKLKLIPFAYYDLSNMQHFLVSIFPLNFRPFNCQLCMIGWISIFVYLLKIPLEYLAPFAVAGAAVLVWKIVHRLETFIS